MDALIDICSIPHFEKDHQHESVFHPIDNPIVPNSDPVETLVPAQFLAVMRPRFGCQRVDLLGYLRESAPINLLQLPCCRRADLNPMSHRRRLDAKIRFEVIPGDRTLLMQLLESLQRVREIQAVFDEIK